MPEAPEIKRIPISEFVNQGYLQELNRQFLHPLGLALEVVVEADGYMKLGGVWDYRDDPEGIAFANLDDESARKTWQVETQQRYRKQPRTEALGYWIQDVPTPHRLRIYERLRVIDAVEKALAAGTLRAHGYSNNGGEWIDLYYGPGDNDFEQCTPDGESTADQMSATDLVPKEKLKELIAADGGWKSYPKYCGPDVQGVPYTKEGW